MAVTKPIMANVHPRLHCYAASLNHQTIIHRQAYPYCTIAYSDKNESVRALKKDKTMVAR